MGSNASQSTDFLTAANTNVLVVHLDEVDESGESVMKHILRDRVLAMRQSRTEVEDGRLRGSDENPWNDY